MKLTRTALVAALALACIAGCKSASQAGAKLTWHTGDAWTRVAELEDARETGDGELVRLMASDDAALRARVATALGRMPFPEVGVEVTRALLGALFDPDANVRAAAAFGLGMRGDASAADKLLFVALDYHESDKDAVVRARALEAATKLDRPELRDHMLDGLLDSDARVRVEAAEGASRWVLTEKDASAVNQRLVDSLANEKDRDVIVYTLFALERRKAKEGIGVFIKFAKSADVEQRLFAVRGLAATAVGLSSSELRVQALLASTSDSDWRVACEAILGLKVIQMDAAVRAATHHSSSHVRHCAWTTIGEWIGSGDKLTGAGLAWEGTFAEVWPVSKEPSAWVRSAVVETLLRSLANPSELARDVDDPWLAFANSAAEDSTPLVRVGAARGLAYMASPRAVPALRKLADDHDLSVAGAAVEALAKHKTPESRAILLEFLADKDNGLRLAAVTSLAEMLDPSDLAPLKKCFDTSTGDGAVEIRFNVLRSVGKIGGDEALPVLVAAFADPNPFVRRVAREEVERSQPMMKVTELDVHIADEKPAFVPIAGRDFPLYERNPQVEVVTTRGTLRFELFPQEAPVHVFNFLQQIERKHYDGLLFHRVVPDFVIQGGDYRGDGNGGGTWRGDADALRNEVTPRKYVRGSLGMPRNEDFESGGSQFFVTHRPTPHLDGRYTIFGELREGFDVLDAIEVGDKIVSVRVVN